MLLNTETQAVSSKKQSKYHHCLIKPKNHFFPNSAFTHKCTKVTLSISFLGSIINVSYNKK